jgi:hypothetical protein
MRISPIVAIALLLTLKINVYDSYGWMASATKLVDEKVLPARSESECLPLADRYDMFVNNEGATDWAEPCEAEENSEGVKLDTISKALVLTVYSSLPAYSPSLGKIELI